MAKWFILALALCGALFFLNHYAPAAWHSGLVLSGHTIPWGVFVIGAVGIIGWRI